MATYVGVRVEGVCTVYRLDLPMCSKLNPQHKLRNHSPCGLEWGYRGSGPAQLALAIIYDVTADAEATLLLYQRFKHEVIASLPRAGWLIESEYVEEWILLQLAAQPQRLDDGCIDLGDKPCQ